MKAARQARQKAQLTLQMIMAQKKRSNAESAGSVAPWRMGLSPREELDAYERAMYHVQSVEESVAEECMRYETSGRAYYDERGFQPMLWDGIIDPDSPSVFDTDIMVMFDFENEKPEIKDLSDKGEEEEVMRKVGESEENMEEATVEFKRLSKREKRLMRRDKRKAEGTANRKGYGHTPEVKN